MTELIVDESRGLTALDMLSTTYRRASALAKKSSKAALSLILILFAFLGFNSFSSNTVAPTNVTEESGSQTASQVNVSPEGSIENPNLNAPAPKATKNQSSVESAKSTELKFPGLDKTGLPTGFTVSDSSGALGTAYFTERTSISNETELIIGQIIKTDAGAANIFLSQTLTTDSYGLTYRPTVSFGQAGNWVPLLVRVSSTDVTRQISGNYLLTVYIGVESAIESPIKIAATASGRDLAAAPKQVITRIVLDPSKTQVLAQAIYVVEKGVKV
jgi:hypothetical protein